MTNLKYRLERLEKAKTKCGLSPAESLELGRMIQGSPLIPGKYPSHVDYKSKDQKQDSRGTAKDQLKDKRLRELLAKLKSVSHE